MRCESLSTNEVLVLCDALSERYKVEKDSMDEQDADFRPHLLRMIL